QPASSWRETGENLTGKQKSPSRRTGRRSRIVRLLSPSRATKPPVRQDMEMMHMVGCGTSHALISLANVLLSTLKWARFVNTFTMPGENARQAHLSRRMKQMRYFGFTAIAASALMLAACGGGEKAADTTAAATTPAADTTAAAAAGSTSTATPAAGAVAAAPITGTIHDVKMIGDAKGYRFEPASITIKEGDGIRYTNVSGGPHDVAFDPAQIPAAVKPQLSANMPDQMSDLVRKDSPSYVRGALHAAPRDGYEADHHGSVAPTAISHLTGCSGAELAPGQPVRFVWA